MDIVKENVRCEPTFLTPPDLNQDSIVEHKKKAETSMENCFSYSIYDNVETLVYLS